MQPSAILSVSDKSGLIPFAKNLKELGYRLLSTGGTLKILKEGGVEATELSHYTGSEELFGGRVKSLHPRVHGSLLFRREKPEEVRLAKQEGLADISLVCVNLYPFQETVDRGADFDSILENIDIGGPSMLRAGAKNFRSVTVVSDPRDYEWVIDILKSKDEEALASLRQRLMLKAFSHTAHYDCLIANYLSLRFEGGLGEKKFIVGSRVFQTSYGENPHQKGALYETNDYYSRHLRTIKGQLSFNNIGDINAALRIVSAFASQPCACIIKHGNPCGFSRAPSLLEAYRGAMVCDSLSAYGGVVALNGILDENLAREILKSFVEVVVCAGVEDAGLALLESKKRLKIVALGLEGADPSRSSFSSPGLGGLPFYIDAWNFRHVEGGFVYQQSDILESNEVEEAALVSLKAASKDEKLDLEVAYKLAALTKSNCITFVKGGVLLAIGMGLTSRVDAMRVALNKAKEGGLSLEGAVMASEAFFPFRDSLELAGPCGISAVIAPGGSIRDSEVIDEANRQGLALYFSKKRHFLH